MDFPAFCKSVNGLHLIDMLGFTKNDDPSQYHISGVMASDIGMPGLELAWQGPISPDDQSKAVTGKPDIMWNDIGLFNPEQIPKNDAYWYRPCYCCAMTAINLGDQSALRVARGMVAANGTSGPWIA